MIFYYSGCGNSRWVAEEIAAATSDQLLFIPDVTKREFNIDEKSVGFVFPIYSWAAPLLVEQFILSCKWLGTPQYVWFACTCGDNIGYAYEKFSKTLKKAGLTLDSGFTIQMPNTYLLMKGFHLDSPELTEQKLQAAKAKLPSLIFDIKSHKKGIKDVIKGRYAYTKTYIIRPGFVKSATDKKFYTESNCTGCGLCVKVCPRHNIELNDGKPHWNGACNQCMACYQHCPTNAIQFGDYTRGKGQYYFKKVN